MKLLERQIVHDGDIEILGSQKIDIAILNKAVAQAKQDVRGAQRVSRRAQRKTQIVSAVASSIGVLANQAHKRKIKRGQFVSTGQTIMRGGFRQSFAAGAQDAWDDFSLDDAMNNTWDVDQLDELQQRKDDMWALVGDMVDDPDYMDATDSRIDDKVDDHGDFLAGLFGAILGLGAGVLLSDELGSRFDLYGGSAVSEYERGYAGVAKGGTDTTGGARHPIWHTTSDDPCPLCDGRDGEEYASADDVECWPTDGDFGECCEGGPNCRCYLEWVDSEADDDDIQSGTDDVPDTTPDDTLDMQLAWWPDLVKIDMFKGSASSGNYGHEGRPGERGGSAAGGAWDGRHATGKDLAAEVKENGGFTYKPGHGFATDHWSVAYSGYTRTSPDAAGIDKFIADHANMLKHADMAVGGWESEGKFYLDMVRLVPGKADAVAMGKREDQIAIFHNGTKTEEPTGGSGGGGILGTFEKDHGLTKSRIDIVIDSIFKGGAGSGDAGHAGVIGQRGGSAPGPGPVVHQSRFFGVFVHDWRAQIDYDRRAQTMWQASMPGASIVHAAMTRQLNGGRLTKDDLVSDPNLAKWMDGKLGSTVMDPSKYSRDDLVKDANFAAARLLGQLQSSGKNEDQLYRGTGVSKDELKNLVPGKDVFFDPASFSDDKMTADHFLPGGIVGVHGNPLDQSEGVRFVIDPGDADHALRIASPGFGGLGEQMVGGRFEVTSVNHFDVEAQQGPGSTNLLAAREAHGTEVHLRQIGGLTKSEALVLSHRLGSFALCGDAIVKGGPGSGFHGHEGRPGERGGSFSQGHEDATHETIVRLADKTSFSRQSKAAQKSAIEALAQYNLTPDDVTTRARTILEDSRTHVISNGGQYDGMTALEAGKRWYEDTNKIVGGLAEDRGVDKATMAASVALTSPTVPWQTSRNGIYSNLLTAYNAVTAATNHDLDGISAKDLVGQKLVRGVGLPGNKAQAVELTRASLAKGGLQPEDANRIVTGMKRSSFAQNILDPRNPDPHGPITVDGQVVAALFPEMSRQDREQLAASKGGYSLVADSIRTVAAESPDHLSGLQAQAAIWFDHAQQGRSTKKSFYE